MHVCMKYILWDRSVAHSQESPMVVSALKYSSIPFFHRSFTCRNKFIGFFFHLQLLYFVWRLASVVVGHVLLIYFSVLYCRNGHSHNKKLDFYFVEITLLVTRAECEQQNEETVLPMDATRTECKLFDLSIRQFCILF